MKWKAVAIAACVALAVVLTLDVIYWRSPKFGLRSLNAVSVVTQVKQLKELVTVRYSLQRVVGLTEPRGAFGEESILLMVQGEAQAGVDLNSLKPDDIHISGEHTITMRLPQAKLFNAYIDESQTKVWDRHITWWTPWIPYDPDLEHKARLMAIDDLRTAALQMGILSQAQKNAQSAICDLFQAFKVDVVFASPQA